MVRRHVGTLFMAACGLFIVGCGRSSPQQSQPAAQSPDTRVRALADSYLKAYFDRYPEEATSYGVPGRQHNALMDNSLGALTVWEANEDAWLSEAKAINPSTVDQAPLRATYAIVREALEGSIAARVCHNELWNVSQMTGWQVDYGYLATIQPVGTDQARIEALARWAALPRYIDTEIANLREGLKRGYSAPKAIVRIVIGQIDTLLADQSDDEPFLSPAKRDTDAQFKGAFTTITKGHLLPAFKRYRDFLQTEYLPTARDASPVSANPDGAACYAAAVRAHSTLPIAPEDVHQLGLKQIARLDAEMKVIAERSFHTSDVPGLLQKVRTDRRYMFKSREELIAYSQAALARAKAAIPSWFSQIPAIDVRIEAYPKFREKNASGEYNAPAEDGSRPGLMYISAYQAEKTSRAPAESTAFHETIPGHHLQTAIALERKSIHPIGRYIRNGGYTEGWALYAEELADEMKLYSSDLDRLGMLSSQAFRAARLVVDSGLHTKGWTRQQAIDYLLAHTAESPDYLASEVDRYIILPGQATSYMLGMLQIRQAREAAQQTMGPKFDIKAFHDRVLEDGAVPVTFLTAKVKAWSEQSR